MKKLRDIEIRERARKLLGVSSIYNAEKLKKNFRRQMKLVNPNGPGRDRQYVPGYSNHEVARLIIQAYRLLTSGHSPTSMLEDDGLVGTMLNGDITPIAETETREEWDAAKFYDQFDRSIWPEPSERDRKSTKYKFQRPGSIGSPRPWLVQR